MSAAVTAILEGMPQPADLRCARVDDQVVVTVGSILLFTFDSADVGMRNLAVATLRSLRFSGQQVAAAFGLSAQYVATVYSRSLREGSAGLVRASGRPGKLSKRQLAQVISWHENGLSNVEIGRRLGVHNSTISRALSGAKATSSDATTEPVTDQLNLLNHTECGETELNTSPDIEPEFDGSSLDVECDTECGETELNTSLDIESEFDGSSLDVECDTECGETELSTDEGVECEPGERAGVEVSVCAGGGARIVEGSYLSRYAGAMLLHAFTDRVDAATIFASAACPATVGQRFDDVAVLTAVSTVFALGFASMEQAKHPDRAQVGPLAGITVLPELRTLRPRLAALADGCDPLELQRAFATAMLAADPCETGVYFVDEHFMPYAGKLPVGKGYNTKRRCAQRGRVDTTVCDLSGRAICFTTGEPSGLSTSLPCALAQLRAITGPKAKLMLGFDRGGAYASVFTACRAQDVDWVTYRRAPLAKPTGLPIATTLTRNGVPEQIVLADETVTINEYGPARQITLFENGVPVLQILTSNTAACAGALIAFLRARWRIENLYKYLDFYGIDYLADYAATITTNTKLVENPARKAARTHLTTLRTELAQLTAEFGQGLTDPLTPATIAAANQALTATQTEIAKLRTKIAQAQQHLKTIPAKLPANQINPQARIALHRAGRRALQMVLRLLAANAEHWLAHHLNTYLQDPNEYRATTRNLMHLAGTITYTPHTITVELHQPNTPRLTHALHLLLDEINTHPPHIPADPRPITYTLKP